MKAIGAVLGLLFFHLAACSGFAMTYAQLALGGGYEAVVIVTNKTGFVWNGTMKPRQGNNARWSGRWSINGQDFSNLDGVTFGLAPRATRKFTFQGDGTTRSGYLEINGDLNSSSLDIAVNYFYEYVTASNQLLDTIGSPDSPFDDKFVFPVEKTALIDTGFAWAPFFSRDHFSINLTLYDSTGNISQRRTETFTGHRAVFFSQVFTGLPTNFMGHILVESQNFIYLTVLRQELTATGFQLTSVPPDDYVP